MKNLSILTIIIFFGITNIALASVSSDKSALYIKDAKEYIKKGNTKAAIIQLKNAIVADPKNPANRIALADLYLQVKNAASAEKEYMKAIDLGVNKTDIIINLSKTRLLQRQFQKIIDTLHEDDVADNKKGEAYLIIGNAYQGLNDLDKALAYYEMGEKTSVKNDNLSIAIAQIYYFKKRMVEAETKTDDVLAKNPKNVRAIILKGELVNLKDGPKKSITYFEQALEYEPKNVSALFKLSAILFDLKRPDEALEKLDIIFSMAPKHPLANYLSAVIYASKNQLLKAEEFLDASGSALDNFPGALILRGVMNFSKQNYAQAIYHLNKLLKIEPTNIVGRRLLGASLLRQNDAKQAVKVLMSAVNSGNAGSITYALLGSAYMKIGNFEEGTKFFEKAVELNPDQNNLKTQLALSKLASGNANAAQGDLQDILEKDPNSKQAAVFITLIHMREKQYDKALEAAERLINQSPENPVGYNLKGAAFKALEKFTEAREQFEKALKVSPLYHSAAMNLADLEFKLGNEAKALKIYKDILKVDNKYTRALLKMARYERGKKNYPVAEKYYQNIIETSPNNIRARIEFSEFFIEQKKLERAKSIAQQIILNFPDHAAGYEASGNIDILMKDKASAVSNFEKMAAILIDNSKAYHLLGRAQMSDRDFDYARNSFVKGLQFAKDKAPLLIELSTLETITGNYQAALKYIDELQKTDVNKPVPYILTGRVYGAQNKKKLALDSFIKAAEFGAKGSQFTIEISRAYIAAEKPDDALVIMQSWLENNPKDVNVRHILASYLLQTENFPKSIEHYEVILEQNDKDAIALNNISWLYSQVGENEKALKAAEKSYNIFPEKAQFIDTYAWILVKQGQNDKGLKLLQKAVLKAPKIMEIRYHYAVALNNAGKKMVAIKELETVISSGEKFSDIDKARSLLNSLSQ